MVDDGTVCANDERPRVYALSFYSCRDAVIRLGHLKINVRFVTQISLGLQIFFICLLTR